MQLGVKSLVLQNFKAFQRLNLPLEGQVSVLVGPNNAGKSTAISALRSAAAMTRIAFRKNPSTRPKDLGYSVWGYPFTSAQLQLDDENLRWDFRQQEVRLELEFTSGLSLRAIWPASDDKPSYFYFARHGAPVLRQIDLSAECPWIAVIPVLTPLEHNEQLLSQDYVVKNLDGRLASRHFRNQLEILARAESTTHSTAFEEFSDFITPWLPEMSLERPQTRSAAKRYELDVYYREGSATRELVWAGDGMQVYVQMLLQLFRNRSADTVILDEPDVYLHADLQRRLLGLLMQMGLQVVVASHSTELVAEAPADAVVWIDRSRSAAVRAPTGPALTELSAAIGSQFNLRLARILRAHAALFVEGKDMSVLRLLARTAGAESIVSETNLAVVVMEGATNWRRLEGFTWLVDQMLGGAVRGYVLLDRDYHAAEAVGLVTKSLEAASLKVHVWNMHELESYLLVPELIGRVTGMTSDWVEATLREVTEEIRPQVLGGMIDMRFADRVDKKQTPGPIATLCSDELESFWNDTAARLQRCPAKEMLSGLNRHLQRVKARTVSAYVLAQEMKLEEMPSEMIRVFRDVERLAKVI